jgi:hypothetical protein
VETSHIHSISIQKANIKQLLGDRVQKSMVYFDTENTSKNMSHTDTYLWCFFRALKNFLTIAQGKEGFVAYVEEGKKVEVSGRQALTMIVDFVGTSTLCYFASNNRCDENRLRSW